MFATTPLHSKIIRRSRRVYWFMDSTPSHTMHKTITGFFSVVRSEWRESTSAPFPVHAMHGYDLSFSHFHCGSILGPRAVLDVIWERFQTSWELNTDLATCTVNASWLKWIEKVMWRQMNKPRNCTSWLSHAYLLHKNLKVSLYSNLSFYLGLRKHTDSEWDRNSGKNVWTKEEQPSKKKHVKTSISICFCLFSWRHNPLWLYFHSTVMGFSLLFRGFLITHDAPQSVGLLWMSDQSVAEPLPDNTQHSQQTNIHAPVGIEPTISEDERPKTYALDRAATGTGHLHFYQF